jgi:hypothetical protein
MDAEEAIREAKDIRVLINDGRMELISERYGEAKQQEAYQFVVEMLPIWRENMARYKKSFKRPSAARAKNKKRATQIAAMQSPEERAAVVAEMAPWDAKWEAANPFGLSTPSNHMVSRALVQTMLKKLNELEPRMRPGGHTMGRARTIAAGRCHEGNIKATIVKHVKNCETLPDWWTKEGGELQVPGPTIFDANNSINLACPRSVCTQLRRETHPAPLIA